NSRGRSPSGPLCALVVWAVLPAGGVLGEVGEVEPDGRVGVIGVGEQLDVVDAGQRDRVGFDLRWRLGVGVPADLLRHGPAGAFAGPVHVDLGEVERVEVQLDLAPDQERV